MASNLVPASLNTRVIFADQLRGIAALLVVLSHMFNVYPFAQPMVSATVAAPQIELPLIWMNFAVTLPWINFGPFGVGLFFLVSGFVAVDRRAWHLVSGLGLNPAVAYLVMARGTSGDNRTTKWSTNSIEKHTGIARSRCKAAVETLEKAGAVWRNLASKCDHPHYKLVPAHEVPSCEGLRSPAGGA